MNDTITEYYANGDVAAVYPDFAIGQPVRVGPDCQGCNFGGADTIWSFAGPTRHPNKCVIRESDHGTTVHVERNRLTARG